MKTFDRNGIRFFYPANWPIEIDGDGDSWAATVQSPQTAFALVSLRPDVENAAQLADEVLAALKAEYADLDAQPALDTLANLPAIGHDIDFLTLDTTILCQTRCIETSAGSLLVLLQCSEYDRAENETVLRAIRESLAVDD